MEGGEDSPPWLLVVFGAVRIESEICPRLTGESDDGPQLWEMEAPSLPQQEGELSFCCYYLPTVSSTYDLLREK